VRQVVPAEPRPTMFSWSFSRPDHHANPSPDRHFCRFDRTRRLPSRGWAIPSGNRRRLVRVQPTHHVTFLNEGSPLFARLRDMSRAICPGYSLIRRHSTCSTHRRAVRLHRRRG
jgi:hypothetical protein